MLRDWEGSSLGQSLGHQGYWPRFDPVISRGRHWWSHYITAILHYVWFSPDLLVVKQVNTFGLRNVEGDVNHAAKWTFSLFFMMQQPLVCQGYVIIEASRSHSDTHSRQDTCGRMIGPSQGPLPGNTQHSLETDINATGGIRTRSPSKREAEDPCLRPRGHWDRLTL